MARKGLHHNGKVKIGGSSARKPKADLSNTYGIKNTSKGGKAKVAVTQGRKGVANTRSSALGKIKGGK